MKKECSRPGNGRERIFVSLGSNLGNRAANLRQALRLLRREPELRVVATSFLYSTSPVGYTAQRDFLNGVAEVRTRLSPRRLLERLQEIERRMGKRVLFRDGPRTIDVDLVLYGRRAFRERDLTVPHPRAHRRRFVLVPLAEIAPRAVHPGLGRTAARLAREAPGGEGVRRWGTW